MGASASKKPANDTEEVKVTPASKKHANDAAEAKKLPASKKITASATKAKKTPASSKPTRRAKKVTVSSKPAPTKPVVKKPAAKQRPKEKVTAKESPKTPNLPPKRTDVLLPGPHEEAPRARAPTKDHAASANCTVTSPQGRSPSPDPSLQVDYEESKPEVDHEAGEPNVSEECGGGGTRPSLGGVHVSSRRPARCDAQGITNAGVDEGVPPDLLQPENRQYLADRSRQAAAQAVGTKRDREAHAPRTRKQLLALRYWTRDEYGEHLRQSRMPGPGALQCDKCPVVLLSDTGLARQRNETEFEAGLHHLGYAEPEFLNSPFRID
ncbi:hypothetical protein PF011_g21150 [Phytophthora fragariae]|uniref:Uncharacterized protein n=1 Tax=Phytophthora fragariae TaxID=53985 RepID=A0A6A3IP65_9STRA|nr:hypothetical protein PF011_g21150 [Phytophthora fragariae]